MIPGNDVLWWHPGLPSSSERLREFLPINNTVPNVLYGEDEQKDTRGIGSGSTKNYHTTYAVGLPSRPVPQYSSNQDL
jgi:hypothetical protein